MPDPRIEARGGATKYRTVKLPNGRYVKVAIVPRAGPRGGHTVATGPVQYKQEPEPAETKRIRLRKANRGRVRVRKVRASNS